MSECIPAAPNNKGAIQYTHLFLCISSGRRLTNFSMRSLYFQIHLHPSLCPLISHSVWCHRPDVHFNAAFYVELSKLEPLTINDLSISFDLYSRQLQSSSHLGIAKLPLNQKETLQKGKKPITYFYHQDPVDLIDPFTPTPVGNIFVTIALGYEEQLNLIEPQTRFIQVQITPIDKKNAKYSSPSLWMKSAHKHGWMSVEEIEENWMEFAQSNGWTPYKKNENLTLETFKPINILKEYESPPTADLLTIHPDSDLPPLFQEPEIIKHELLPPEEIAQIFPQPKIEFNNKIKKPITVMDFFPRLSYSNKYDSIEKSDSEWDILIGKYLKTSSSTLKSFPKQKRTKSASFNKPPFSQNSLNRIQNSNKKKIDKNSNIEQSSSQSYDTKRANNSLSQSESSELDNNFLMMLNDDHQNKNDQNKFKNSKKFNKKYNLDDDEKEWSSDFFSDSPDAASNHLDLDQELANQENDDKKNKPFNLSLEEIVEKEMEKLSKNSKNSSQKIHNKDHDTNNEVDSNEVIQSPQNSINIQSSQKVENENLNSTKSKPVFFSPPPSLTQVVQKADKYHEKFSNQKVFNSKSSIDQLKTQVENVNIPEEEIYENDNIEIQRNNNIENIVSDQNFQNYSNADDHQIQDQQQIKKSHKRKHRTKSIQQAIEPNPENDPLQADQQNNIQNELEKPPNKRRKLKSPSPPKRLKEPKNKDKQMEIQDENNTYINDDNQGQIYYDNNSPEFTSPPMQPIQANKYQDAFSVPSHRRRHNEDEPIRPYQPVFQDEIEQFNEYYQKVKQDEVDTQKSSIKKRKSDQHKDQIHHKKRHHQDLNQSFSIENPPSTENSTFSEQKQKQPTLQVEEDEEEQPTSPKVQFDQDGSREPSFSAQKHRHRHKKREDDDQFQFKIYDEEKETHDDLNDKADVFNVQDDQPIQNLQKKRKRSSNQPHKNDDETQMIIQKVDDFGSQLLANNDQAASSSAPSSTSPSQSPQGQQITVTSSSNSHHSNRHQKVPETDSPDHIDQQPPPSSEKVLRYTKSQHLSPSSIENNNNNHIHSHHQKHTKDSSSADSNASKTACKRFLPSPDDILNGRDLTIAEKFSPDSGKTSSGSFRSFIPTSQSMADQKGGRSIPKRKISRNNNNAFYTVDPSSMMNRTMPIPVQPYRPSASFIESISTESSLKKRKKRHNLTHSNSPKPQKEASFLETEDFIDNGNNFSKTFVVHSPTINGHSTAKAEGEFSPQLIDFSSTSPISIATKFSHKKRASNSPLKNFNYNQNLNRNEIKDEIENMHSFKKSKAHSKYTKDSPEIQDDGEILDVEVKHRKSLKKSPVKKEKKTPKKPMDIKTAASFGPGPLSPATPNAQKKGIRMSPSLERMINGIDKLENSFDMSGIESDYED